MVGVGASRGALILLEGIDRCGKSTQVQMLADSLNRQCRSTEIVRFPNRTTTIGKTINSYLSNACDMDDKAIHLLFSANRWESFKTISNLLLSGKHVVMDRYSYSGAAYSAAKEGLSLEWCMNPEKGLLHPDAIIFLDISIEAAKNRAEYGVERYEKEDFQRKVHKNFEILRTQAKTPWHVVDASLSMKDVHHQVEKIAKNTIEQVALTPLTYM